MMDSVKKGDETEMKLSVEMMVGTGAELSLEYDEAKKAGTGNGSVPKVSSPNKSSTSVPGSPKTDCQTLARRLSEQAVSRSRPDQWGLLTAVTEKARKRTQGCHIMLHNFEHILGRIVAEVSCMFESPAVSGRHCTLTRKLISFDGRIKSPGSDRTAGDVLGTFVKDSSSNGTFINKEKLKKNGPEVRLRHGDIISLVALPEHENAFAFVFREVIDVSSCKRKGSPSDHEAEVPSAGDGKRIRNTGKCTAASEGPVSLDDVRRLQRSNEELRQQLEAKVLEMEKLRGEFRAAEALHLVELKELRASVTEMYAKQIEEIRQELVSRSKEVEESTALCSHQDTTIEDLNHRLASAAQSRLDAEEAIRSQATSIAELKKRLDEEFSQHQKERAEWEANLEAALERTRMEASEELKRHSDASARLQKQQQDTIADLQEADKENSHLADSLRIKLEAERQAVIVIEEKGRRLGMQLQEERIARENSCKRAAELQEEISHVHKELESEKEAREFAAAKVTSLELAMETAIRDLTLEKQRLQGARERIVLRETQLRTFYSTAAQVEALQQKQQEQLKAMLRTLEDGNGEGAYPESGKPKTLGQSERVGNETKILASWALRQTSCAPNASHLLLDNGLHVHTRNADGEEKQHRLEARKSSGPNAGYPELDWMDGDTQQEDEACLVVSRSPSTSKPLISGADVSRGDQHVVGEEGDSGPKAVSLKTDEETQVFQDHGIPSTTQLLADTLQEIGSSEGQVFLKESMGFMPRFWHERRKSNLGMDAPGSVSRDDQIMKGYHGTVNEESERDENTTIGLASVGATMKMYGDWRERFPKKSVGTETVAQNDGLSPDGSPILNVGSRMSDTCQDSQARKSKEAATICTDDLLTSEVAGSWALGTQASVHTGNEVGSHRIVAAGLGGALHNDTQLVIRELEGTMCTDDLLASEVAGSWAAGTPASVHADNESISSDERDHPGPDEGGSQVAATLSKPRLNPRHARLEDVMHFADPVNSQNSLSPATTNPARNDRDALNEMLDIVEPGFGCLHDPSKVTRHQSDIDDSTTDGEDENEVNTCNDGSQPLNQSPSVSVN